jgi:trk system potassium uptake protein
MKILVIGNDLRTQLLLRSLHNDKHAVTLISDSLPFCEQIADQFEQTTIHGDGCSLDILAEASADQCDLLIAMMDRDADNLVACELAKKKFRVPRTISTVENPTNIIVFQRLGVDSVICSAEACSRMVESTVNHG